MNVDELLADLPPEVAQQVRDFIEQTNGPVTSTDPRRHHFVPQFYLRRFAAKSGDKAVIATVPVEDPLQARLGNVADTAVIRDFYTVVGDDNEDTVAVEKLLALIEGAAASPLERLAAGVFFPPNDEDRAILGLLFALQLVRGPDHRRHMEALADLIVRMSVSLADAEGNARAYLEERDGRVPTEAEVEGLVEDMRSGAWEAVPSQNDLVKLMLEGAESIAPYITMRKWCLVRFSEPGLVTTDRPVILYTDSRRRSPQFGIGVATAEEVMIPLGRSELLVLHNYPDMGEHVMPATHSLRQCNEMIVFHASREVYAHPDDLEGVLDLDMPDPHHPIGQVDGLDFVGRLPDGINAPPTRQRPRRYNRSRNVPRSR